VILSRKHTAKASFWEGYFEVCSSQGTPKFGQINCLPNIWSD